jgi:hypothetical protein
VEISSWVPHERVYAFCRRKEYSNLDLCNARSRPQFLDSSDAEIVLAFNLELCGFANYYAIADGVNSSLGRLELVVFRSLMATVAARHRKSTGWAKKNLKLGADYGATCRVRGKLHVLPPWKLKHLKLEPWYRAAVDSTTVGSRLTQSRNDLIARLNACQWEACDDTEDRSRCIISTR